MCLLDVFGSYVDVCVCGTASTLQHSACSDACMHSYLRGR